MVLYNQAVTATHVAPNKVGIVRLRRTSHVNGMTEPSRADGESLLNEHLGGEVVSRYPLANRPHLFFDEFVDLFRGSSHKLARIGQRIDIE